MQPPKYQNISKNDKKFAIVDGNALLHRAYHAYPQTLRTKKGELVNAVYGFSRLIITLISDLKPSYLTIAFDTGAPTFRHLDYVGYKAHRPKMEDNLASQLDLLKELVDAMGVRRSTGQQAEILNQIMDDFYKHHTIQPEKLKELIGHTPLQVVAGIIVGFIVSLGFHWYWAMV